MLEQSCSLDRVTAFQAAEQLLRLRLQLPEVGKRADSSHFWQTASQHPQRRHLPCLPHASERYRLHHGSCLLLDALHRRALLLVDRGPKRGLQVCAEALKVGQGLCEGLESSNVSCVRVTLQSSEGRATCKDVVA